MLSEHRVETGIGRLVRLPKNAVRFKESDYSSLKGPLLTALANVNRASEYVELLIQKYPRYARDQLRILQKCAAAYSVDELKKAFDYCFERDLISANDLRDTLVFFRQDEPKITPKPVLLPEKYQAVKPKVRNIAKYSQPSASMSMSSSRKRGDDQ